MPGIYQYRAFSFNWNQSQHPEPLHPVACQMQHTKAQYRFWHRLGYFVILRVYYLFLQPIINKV